MITVHCIEYRAIYRAIWFLVQDQMRRLFRKIFVSNRTVLKRNEDIWYGIMSLYTVSLLVMVIGQLGLVSHNPLGASASWVMRLDLVVQLTMTNAETLSNLYYHILSICTYATTLLFYTKLVRHVP